MQNDDVDPDIEQAWGALSAALPSLRPRRLNNDRRGKLAARIRTHGIDVVLRTFRWIGSSQHRMAVYLRERNDVDTPLWDSKFDRYAEFSAEPDVPLRALAAFARWRALSGSTDEPAPSLAAPILAAIDAIGEAETIAVIEWVLAGTDGKARFLQSKGVRSIQAVLNPDKLHGRRDLARAAKPVRIGAPIVTPTTAMGSHGVDEVDLGPNASLGYAPTDHLRRPRRPAT